MPRRERGVLIAVGGHSRRVGKTSMMEAILRSMPRMEWHAYKISRHRHDGEVPPTGDLRTEQTERYLAAGAATARLLRLTDEAFGSGVRELELLLRAGRNVVVESNRTGGYLAADVTLFVIDPGNADWKASSAACLSRADALVLAGPGAWPPMPPRVVFGLTQWDQTPTGFAGWLRERLRREPQGQLPAAPEHACGWPVNG